MVEKIQGAPAIHYVDTTGKYLGGFAGGHREDGSTIEPTLPAGAVVVAGPPPHADQRWNGTGWDPAAEQMPSPAQARRRQISALLGIPRSDWTAAQYRELLQLVAQEQTQ